MCEKGGLCILRIRNIFSACAVWFTFVSRTQEHRAVGSSGIGLTDSRGSFPLWDCLSLTSWIYCTTNLLVCQYLFEKILRRWWELNPHFPMANVSKWATLLYLSHFCGSRTVLPHRHFVPLLYHTLRGLSRGFFEKLDFFYSLLLRTVRALFIAPTKRFIKGNGYLPHALWEVSHLFPSWQL